MVAVDSGKRQVSTETEKYAQRDRFRVQSIAVKCSYVCLSGKAGRKVGMWGGGVCKQHSEWLLDILSSCQAYSNAY